MELTLKSNSKIFVEKDKIEFRVTFSCKSPKLEEAINKVVNTYKNFSSFLGEEFTTYFDLKKDNLNTGINYKRIEKILENNSNNYKINENKAKRNNINDNCLYKKEYENIFDSYYCILSCKVIFDIEDIKNYDFDFSQLYNYIINANKDECFNSSLNYRFIVSDENLNKKKSELKNKLISDSKKLIRDVLNDPYDNIKYKIIKIDYNLNYNQMNFETECYFNHDLQRNKNNSINGNYIENDNFLDAKALKYIICNDEKEKLELTDSIIVKVETLN